MPPHEDCISDGFRDRRRGRDRSGTPLWGGRVPPSADRPFRAEPSKRCAAADQDWALGAAFSDQECPDFVPEIFGHGLLRKLPAQIDREPERSPEALARSTALQVPGKLLAEIRRQLAVEILR